MTTEIGKELRCAIYTRVSTEHGLEQEFNSLDAQREASEAYIKSQKHEGWQLIQTSYDDGGYSGGTINRPALQKMLADIRERKIDIVVVYKVDRLTRSLADFAKLIELFDAHSVSFVSVTQAFNTTTSMGRLTLNVLLSFAQFEREVTGERIRDKIAASKRKGMRMGGPVPLGYDVKDKKLRSNVKEPVSTPQFPANREKNRELFKIGADSQSRGLDKLVNSRGWLEIPYSLEQGISWQQQGNLERDQGILAASLSWRAPQQKQLQISLLRQAPRPTFYPKAPEYAGAIIEIEDLEAFDQITWLAPAEQVYGFNQLVG